MIVVGEAETERCVVRVVDGSGGGCGDEEKQGFIVVSLVDVVRLGGRRGSCIGRRRCESWRSGEAGRRSWRRWQKRRSC